MKIKVYISATAAQQEIAEKIARFLRDNGHEVVKDVVDCNLVLLVLHGDDSKGESALRFATLKYAKSKGIKVIPVQIGRTDKTWYEKAYGSLIGSALESVSDVPILGKAFDAILSSGRAGDSKGRNSILDKKFGAPAAGRDMDETREPSIKNRRPESSFDRESHQKSASDSYEEYETRSRGSVDRESYEESTSKSYEEEATRASADREEYEEVEPVEESYPEANARPSTDYEKGYEPTPSRDIPRMEAGPPAEDDVTATLFAPDSTVPGRDILVEVFVHIEEDAADVEKIAKERDQSARKQMAGKLRKKIPRGSALVFELRMGELQAEIDEPVQEYTWEGEIIEVPFTVNVPVDFPAGAERGKVIVSANGTPVGRLLFKVEIGSRAADAKASAQSRLKRYQKAFISYSSKDRPEVLRRVHMLDINGIDYFQDVLKLDPGQRWEQKLYEHIDSCDVVFLFWSTPASTSKWIAREIIYANDRRKSDPEGDPDIIPIIIEGPPPVPPPETLRFLHFNDKMAYMILAADAESEVLKERNKEH